MRWRDTLAVLGATTAVLAGVTTVRAVAQNSVPAIGILGPGFPTSYAVPEMMAAFDTTLRELGYVDGKTIRVVYRWAGNDFGAAPALAAELEREGVQIILTAGTTTVRAAAERTSVPIIMAGAGDPVALGLADSLARPGGRFTGLSFLGADALAKRVQLLCEAAPGARNLAALLNGANPGNALYKRGIEAGARASGVNVNFFEVRKQEELAGTFESIGTSNYDAVFVIDDPLFISHPQLLAELALRHRLPMIVGDAATVRAGALMGWEHNYPEFWRRAAVYVDQILRGIPPGDIPIEQPRDLRLIINAQTAHRLKVEIPPSLLARADEVIE